MRILINNLYRPELEQSSFQLDQQASDPVPTCSFALYDETSSFLIDSFQEVIVLDETAYPAPPTHNFLQNPAMNPYTSVWTPQGASGIALSQQSGGGLTATLSNASPGDYTITAQMVPDYSLAVPKYYIQPEQDYTLSVTVAGSPVNARARLSLQFFDGTGAALGGTVSSSFSVTGSPQVISLTANSGAGAAAVSANLNLHITSNTNSGTITFTEAQVEANWFPDVSYPTLYVDGAQTNGYTLPDGTAVREKRLFGGWITHHKFQPVGGGPVAIWTITCSAYGWLFDKRTNNSTYTSQQDGAIITGLVSEYFSGLFTTNHVSAAPLTISILQYGYDTLRKIMDDLCTLTLQRWYIDPYGDVWYQPQGYGQAQASYGLSDNPDGVTTFAYSSYLHESDFTQPTNSTTVKINVPPVDTTSATSISAGSVVVTPADMTNISVNSLLVFSGGHGVTETVQVTAITSTTFTATFASSHTGAYKIRNDTNTNALGIARIEQGQARARYGLVFEKYIDDSQIVDQGMAHTRGVSENIQNAYTRETIHLELDEQAAQSEIAPGVSIQITSTGEGILARSYFIQKVSITILASGDSTLRTRYKYAVDLGSYNPNLENLLVKNFVQATSRSTVLPGPTAWWVMADETLGFTESESHTP